MKVWGITGGVGMGKSAAGELLTQRQVRVVDTDSLARELTAPGTPALNEIQSEFGSDMVQADGQLDRKRLAERVFQDASARARLESILHPRIAAQWRNQVEDWRVGDASDAAVLIPLLFERGYEAEFSAVVVVACTKATQRERLRQRGWTDTEIESRNAAQWAIEDKMARARFVVWTEGSFVQHGRQWDRILSAA
jgi:dephospho-CoA kinase